MRSSHHALEPRVIYEINVEIRIIQITCAKHGAYKQHTRKNFWRHLNTTDCESWVMTLCNLVNFVKQNIEAVGSYLMVSRSTKMYSNPITGLERPLGLQEVEGPSISRQSVHGGGKFVRPTYRPPLPPPPPYITHFCYRLSRYRGYSAAGRIKSIKNTNNAIGK